MSFVSLSRDRAAVNNLHFIDKEIDICIAHLADLVYCTFTVDRSIYCEVSTSV